MTSPATVFALQQLVVKAHSHQQVHTLVDGISLRLQSGKTTALVGESGSGKSITARSLVGLTGAHTSVTAATMSCGGHDLRSLSQAGWRAWRGREIGFVLQDALVSLDPMYSVQHAVGEAMRAHRWGSRTMRQQRSLDLLAQMGVPDPARLMQRHPFELSGGLRQRVLIAAALALDPKVLIADEPTTALDAAVQNQVLELLQQVVAQGRALLLISHDLGVVAQLADEIHVLRGGQVVESGPAQQVLSRPQHPYTAALIAAQPSRRRLFPPRPRSPDAIAAAPLLQATGLLKRYPRSPPQAPPALAKMDMCLRSGEGLGIVGESGSGKTTLAHILLGLLPPDQGTVLFDGRPWNVAGPAQLPEAQRRSRRSALGAVYQDPLGSFDPRWSVQQILRDALDAGGIPRPAHGARIDQLLSQLGLPPQLAQRWPQQLSGGQRQRVAIARALATEPRVLICDEAVSALDVLVQAQILDLLLQLRQSLNLSYVFISHDLNVVRQLCDRVLVMYRGEVVEQGPVAEVLVHPRHGYTQALLAASLQWESK